MNSIPRLCVGVVVAALLIAVPAFADLAGAKKALEDAKKNIADKDWSGADYNVKLVDVELDGVADADKKAIQTELDGLKKQVLQNKIAKDKEAFTHQADSFIEQAKNDLVGGDPSSVLHDLDSFNYFVNRDDVRVVFTPEEIKAMRDRMSKYTKVAENKMADNKIDALTKTFDEWEPKYKENLAKLKSSESESQADGAARDISQELQSMTSRMSDLPADNDKVKALKGRIDKMNAEFTAVNNADTIKRKLARMQENWKTYESEYGGWEAEKPEVTFEQYSKNSSQEMYAFNMPKSHALVQRATYQLEGMGSDESYKQVSSDPQIKAFVDNLTKMRDTAVDKFNKVAVKLVEEAEKAKIDRDEVSHLNHLKEGLRYNLGEKAPQTAALTARVQRLIDGYDKGVADADAAQKQLYEKLVKEASDKWPTIQKRYSSAKSIDPANLPAKGTLILMEHRANRASWEFAGGGYDFVSAINGVPVAAKYDPGLKAAIDDIENRTGKNISDEYYDLVGVLETTCRVQESEYSQILQKWVPTVIHNDAPLLRIVALHAGALAAAGDSPSESGSSVASLGGGSSRAGGWAMRFFILLVGLSAAAAALLKAGYAPVASVPQVGEVQAKLGADNLAYIGLACAGLGVLFLLMGRILWGFVPNIAIIAAGTFAAIDLLAARGIVKPDQVMKIKPLGVPIGLACAAAVILSLLLGMVGLNMVII